MIKNIYNYKNGFSVFFTGITIVAFIVIWFLSQKTAYIEQSYLTTFSLMLRILFVGAMVFVGFKEFLSFDNEFKKLLSLRSFLLSSLVVAIVFSISDYKLSSYSVGLFVFFALIYFVQNKTFYTLNKVYYLLFAYALLQLVGTFNTPRGFHFPEKTYSFYIIPLAFCLFNFTNHTWLRVLKTLFRILFLYCLFTLINWWFNVLSFDINPFTWLTTKINDIQGFSAWYYIGQWANFKLNGVAVNYSHPTFVSLVLISGLIIGFYLRYKKNERIFISTFELILYAFCTLLVILAFESRIGAVGFIIITFTSLVYYIKLKTDYFKRFVFLAIVGLIVVLTLTGNKIIYGFSDKPREISYAFAMHHIKENIWWGCGTEEQKTALNNADIAIPEVERIKGFPQYLYTHNQFLGETVQFGIWGFVMLFILVAGFMLYAFKSRNYMLQMFWLLYFLCMMIEEPLYIQQGILRFCVFLTLFVAVGNTERTAIKWKFGLKNK